VKSTGGDSTKPVSPASVQEPGAAAPPGPQRPGAPSARAIKVEISSLSADEVGVVDSARVQAAKQAIIEGRLQVDPGVVADKLLSATREFLVATK
jgi:flagellar biosynthesis anti-sigma factor FlgM